MEAFDDAALIARVRSFGLQRLLDGLPDEAQRDWEQALLQACEPLREADGAVRLGGLTRLVRARCPAGLL